MATKRKTTEIGTNNPRLAKFTELVVDGQNMYQAAIAAGYSDSIARNAYRELMPRAQDVFRRALAHHAPIGVQARKIAEGMDAMETQFFQKDGVVTDQRDVIAWGARKQYLDLAAKCQGFIGGDPATGDTSKALLIEVMSEGSMTRIAIANELNMKRTEEE